MSAQAFGDLIRGARQKKGLSLRALAQELGFSVPYLSDVETGRRNPFAEPVLKKLAKVLDLDLDEMRLAAALSRGYYQLPISSARANKVAAALTLRWGKLTEKQLGEIAKIVG